MAFNIRDRYPTEATLSSHFMRRIPFNQDEFHVLTNKSGKQATQNIDALSLEENNLL